MDKRIVLFVIFVVLSIVPASIVLVDADQKNNNTIEVSSWGDLNEIRDNPDELYNLVNDLDKNINGYEKYGSEWEPISSFSGEFDGNGYIIADFEYRSDKQNYIVSIQKDGVWKNTTF